MKALWGGFPVPVTGSTAGGSANFGSLQFTHLHHQPFSLPMGR